MIDRTELLRVLEAIRNLCCVYSGTRCDCKYSDGTAITNGHEKSNGCAELRLVMSLLSELTESELVKLDKRMNKTKRKKRNLAEELIEGLKDLGRHRRGEITLKTTKIEKV